MGSDEVSEFSWIGVCLVMAAVLSQAVFFVGSQVANTGGHREALVEELGRGRGFTQGRLGVPWSLGPAFMRL